MCGATLIVRRKERAPLWAQYRVCVLFCVRYLDHKYEKEDQYLAALKSAFFTIAAAKYKNAARARSASARSAAEHTHLRHVPVRTLGT